MWHDKEPSLPNGHECRLYRSQFAALHRQWYVSKWVKNSRVRGKLKKKTTNNQNNENNENSNKQQLPRCSNDTHKKTCYYPWRSSSFSFVMYLLLRLQLKKTIKKILLLENNKFLFFYYDKTLKAGKIILNLISVLPFSKGSNKKNLKKTSATIVNYESSLKILRDVLL